MVFGYISEPYFCPSWRKKISQNNCTALRVKTSVRSCSCRSVDNSFQLTVMCHQCLRRTPCWFLHLMNYFYMIIKSFPFTCAPFARSWILAENRNCLNLWLLQPRSSRGVGESCRARAPAGPSSAPSRAVLSSVTRAAGRRFLSSLSTAALAARAGDGAQSRRWIPPAAASGRFGTHQAGNKPGQETNGGAGSPLRGEGWGLAGLEQHVSRSLLAHPGFWRKGPT